MRYILALLILIMTGTVTTSQAQDTPDLSDYQIYFTETNREVSRFDRSPAGISRFAGLIQRLGAQMYTLEWRNGIPDDADLIVIIGPTLDLTADQIARLWAYVYNGGRLLLITEPSERALLGSRGLLNLMWNDLGLRGRDDVVGIESAFSEEGTTNDLGILTSGLVTAFTTDFMNNSHPVTANIEGPLLFDVARSIEIDTSIRSSTVTPLVFSDPSFYGETAYAEYLETGVLEYNIGEDTGRDALALIATFEDPDVGSRIVLIGDSHFALNGVGMQTSPAYSGAFVFPNNAQLLMNAVAWLLESEPAETNFPTPVPTGTPTTTPSPTPSPMPTALPTATPATGG